MGSTIPLKWPAIRLNNSMRRSVALSTLRIATVYSLTHAEPARCSTNLKLEVKAAGVEDSFHDVEFFDKKRHACTEYQPQFYDLDRSWGAALRRIIESADGEMRP